MEGDAEDLHEEVNGVAGHVALRPAPVAVFEDQAFVSSQLEVAVLISLDEFQAAFLQERSQRHLASCPYVLAIPTGLAGVVGLWGVVMRLRCHGLCSNEVV